MLFGRQSHDLVGRFFLETWIEVKKDALAAS